MDSFESFEMFDIIDDNSTSTATSTVMNTEQQPDVSDLDFLFDNNDLQALFDNSFEIQNENVLNQKPVAVNSSALDQNMCSPNNNISALNDNMVPIVVSALQAFESVVFIKVSLKQSDISRFVFSLSLCV
jgi:hypothetical protein